MKAYRARLKQRVFETISTAWNDKTLQCQIALTPNTPVSDLPCRGSLQIDHLNGNGRKERLARGTESRYLDIVKGRTPLRSLRILCQLHQLWNQIKDKP